MAGAAHGAMPALAPAGGLPRFSAVQDRKNTPRHDGEKNQNDQKRRPIRRKPSKHKRFLLSRLSGSLRDGHVAFEFFRLTVFFEEKHIDGKSNQGERNDQPEDVPDRRCRRTGCEAPVEDRTDLIDDERHGVGEPALITDREPGPFAVVHLALDRADRGETGRAEQVEDQDLVFMN